MDYTARHQITSEPNDRWCVPAILPQPLLADTHTKNQIRKGRYWTALRILQQMGLYTMYSLIIYPRLPHLAWFCLHKTEVTTASCYGAEANSCCHQLFLHPKGWQKYRQKNLISTCLGKDDRADIPDILGILMNRPIAAELGWASCVEDRHPCP